MSTVTEKVPSFDEAMAMLRSTVVISEHRLSEAEIERLLERDCAAEGFDDIDE